MTTQGFEMLTRRDMPKTNVSVIAPAGDEVALGIKSHCLSKSCMPIQSLNTLPCLHLP